MIGSWLSRERCGRSVVARLPVDHSSLTFSAHQVCSLIFVGISANSENYHSLAMNLGFVGLSGRRQLKTFLFVVRGWGLPEPKVFIKHMDFNRFMIIRYLWLIILVAFSCTPGNYRTAILQI